MASPIVNIPVCSIPDAFTRNQVEDLRWFLILKAREGRWIHDPAKYQQKVLNRFVRRKWLVLHDGKYYQRKRTDVFPLEDRFTHGKLEIETLEDPTLFKAMLFLLGFAYLMSPQVPRRAKSRVADATQVKESRHNGGASHSICMGFFGFKKTWCSKMRKLCEKLGIAKWDRRWVEVPVQKWGNIPMHVATQLLEGNARYRVRCGNIVEEEVTAAFTQIQETRLHIPYEYRSIVKQHYS